MRTRIQRWGNSLAVRIPELVATALKLDHDSEVDLTIVNDCIAIISVDSPTYRLEQLLDGITEDNLHHEISTDDARGNEAW